MKHLSLWLTVLLLSALPFTAAAFDYGPNQSLLASNDSSSPQLPGAQVRAAAEGEMPKADANDVAVANADDAVFSNPVTTQAQTHQAVPPGPSPTSPPRSHGPSASNKSRQQHPASSAAPGTAPSPPSWQSLLPGSIQ